MTDSGRMDHKHGFREEYFDFFKKKVAVFVTDQNDPYMHPFVNIVVVLGAANL